MRARSLVLSLLLSLTACSIQPATADVAPDPTNLPRNSLNTERRTNSPRPDFSITSNHYDFDPNRGPIFDPRIEDNLWYITPGAWGASTEPLPLPAPYVLKLCVANPSSVPGPLPLLGLGTAFIYSRKLRRRIHASNSYHPHR